MINIQKLNKFFTTTEVETHAINNLDLKVNKGDFLAIMGPSGCGKSTLLNIIGLLDVATSGSYVFDDIDVSSLNEKKMTTIRKGKVGFVFQDFNLIDEFTVYENVELPLQYLKIQKQERKEKINSVLKRIRMDHRANHFPKQLSGGQQQRAAIARALVSNPKLILADEPTGNLDSKTGVEVMELLSELNKGGTTIVMVTHSERDSRYANRRVLLSDGKIVKEESLLL